MNLIQKYISGDYTPEELQELKIFLDTPEGQIEWEQETKELWHKKGLAKPFKHRNAEAALENILLKVKTPESVQEPGMLRLRRRLLYYAAAAVLLIITTTFYLNTKQVKWLEQSTAFGQQKTIELPDGSVVILNGHSSLRYAASPSFTKSRETWLQGEGFFDVKHTKGSQRFTVHLSDHSKIDVLGTAFNVHQGSEGSEVVLQRGKIEWRQHGGKSIVMAPGDKLNYSKLGHIAIERNTRAQQYSSWTNGYVVLDGLSLKEVTIRLQDIYGWTFDIKNDTLAAQTLWGSLPVDDPNLILKGLAHATGTQVREYNNKVTISNK